MVALCQNLFSLPIAIKSQFEVINDNYIWELQNDITSGFLVSVSVLERGSTLKSHISSNSRFTKSKLVSFCSQTDVDLEDVKFIVNFTDALKEYG